MKKVNVRVEVQRDDGTLIQLHSYHTARLNDREAQLLVIRIKDFVKNAFDNCESNTVT